MLAVALLLAGLLPCTAAGDEHDQAAHHRGPSGDARGGRVTSGGSHSAAVVQTADCPPLPAVV